MGQLQIDLKKNGSIEWYESALSDLRKSDNQVNVRLPTDYGAGFFTDIWAAILVGTACRDTYYKHDFLTWGIKEYSSAVDFHKSLPGLTALQLSPNVFTEEKNRITIDDIAFSPHMMDSTKAKYLLELDPQMPIDQRLQSRDRATYNRQFRQLILEFRSDLELGYRNHKQNVEDRGAPAELITFIKELQENSFKYCRMAAAPGDRFARGFRLTRLKAHIAPKKEKLIERAQGNTLLTKHLNETIPQKGWCGVMEASISDFGPGIVDHFICSPKGSKYVSVPRKALLKRLIEEPLSSSTKIGSGFGLSNAIEAAQSMKAFVSLRTAEFWRAKSFACQENSPSLDDVRESNPSVAGTHWQFVWSLGL